MPYTEALSIFKLGFEYIMRYKENEKVVGVLREKITSDVLQELLQGFLESDETLRILINHIPPSEMTALSMSNTREALQEATWNAFSALWSLREVFGRLKVC